MCCFFFECKEALNDKNILIILILIITVDSSILEICGADFTHLHPDNNNNDRHENTATYTNNNNYMITKKTSKKVRKGLF